MNKVTALFLMFVATGVQAQVSTGGSFVLEKSLVGGTAVSATAGSQISLRASMGENFYQAAGLNPVLCKPLKRLFDGFLGPLKIDPSVSNVLSFAGGDVQIGIPGGAIPQAYETMATFEPMDDSIAVPASKLHHGTQQLVATYGSYVNLPSAIIEVQLLMADNTLFSDQMPVPASFQLAYPDRGDGSAARAYRFDDTTEQWVLLTLPSMVSALSVARANQFANLYSGIFAIFQQGPVDVAQAYAYPVPWRPNAHQPALYGTLQDGITFTNIPTLGTIEIYDLKGQLVRDVVIPPGSTEWKWNVKTGAGNDVVSGVYIWSIQSFGNRKTGKLMVIR